MEVACRTVCPDFGKQPQTGKLQDAERMGTGISEASKRVPIFPLLPREASK